MASRKEILELLASGKITAEEAAEMLSTPSAPEPEAAPPPPSVEKEIEVLKSAENGSNGPKWFKVRVRNLETGKNKVNVNIPIRMLKFGMSIGKRFAPEMDELRWDDIDGMVKDMQIGMLVEVQDEDSNEHVQVYLE